MKATIAITVILILTPFFIKAQTLNEWVRQKKTQKKYLIDQIAALKIYTGYLKDGYRIVHGGLSTIENIKNGNFTMDMLFFDSRKNVNPAIKNSVKVANIIGYQVMIIRNFKRFYLACQADEQFTADEILYIGHVYANLLRSCDFALADLQDIIKSGRSDMTDDERMMRIDTIHDDMQDKYAFVESFGNSTRLLSFQRSKEAAEIAVMRKNYETL